MYIYYYIYTYYYYIIIYISLILFNCKFWDSVPDGSLQWSSSFLVWFPWRLQHGDMNPTEGTFFKVNVDWPTSEFTHVNLVIRLRKVQQSSQPCRASPFLGCPAAPVVYGNFANPPSLLKWCCPEQPETIFQQSLALQQDMGYRRQQACPFPAGMVSLVFDEVDHFVRLLHLNLNSCLMPTRGVDRLPSPPGHNARLPGQELNPNSINSVVLHGFIN